MKTVILVYVLIGLMHSIYDAKCLHDGINDRKVMKETKDENLNSDIDLNMKCMKDTVINEVVSGNSKIVMIMYLMSGIINIVAWPILMYKEFIIVKDTIKRRIKK